MATGERCPRCGAALTAGAPLGLCPACLLKAGLEAPTDGPTMDTGSGEGEAPTYEARPANQPARGGAGFAAPDHVGPYHIQGVLGEGGMGIVSLRAGTVVQRTEEMPTTTSLAVNPDGSRIAMGTGESQILILDARTLATLLAIRVDSQTTRAFLSADGTRLIMTGWSGRTPVVRVHDARAPHESGAQRPARGR
jgi:hypothetical protein